MGYYVTLLDCSIDIPPDLHRSICDHLLTSGFLNPANMSGGRYSPDDGPQERWFSWVNMENLRTALLDGDLVSVFENFRFEVILKDGTNHIVDLHFVDSKCGDEEKLFTYLAPLLPGETRLTWQGEGGEQWRYLLKDGAFRWLDGITIFPDDPDQDY